MNNPDAPSPPRVDSSSKYESQLDPSMVKRVLEGRRIELQGQRIGLLKYLDILVSLPLPDLDGAEEERDREVKVIRERVALWEGVLDGYDGMIGHYSEQILSENGKGR